VKPLPSHRDGCLFDATFSKSGNSGETAAEPSGFGCLFAQLFLKVDLKVDLLK
jgi:hypothetical protein